MMKIKILFTLCVCVLFSAYTTDNEQKTIFMIGDSTMANKDITKGNIERGWGQMLPGFLSEDIFVDNHAANGRSTLSFINEGRWDSILSKMKKGDYVFIQFGHNDEKAAENLHTVPGGSFDDNLKRFVNETRSKGGNPVLFNSIVRRNFPPTDTTAYKGSYEIEGNILVDTHGDYANAPRNVAKELDVPFIDMNSLTHDLVMKMGTEESKKLFMWVPEGRYEFSPEGKIDNTHLNIHGGRVFARIAIDEIIKVIPEFSEYIRYYDLVVAKDGSGDFFSIRAAIDSASSIDKDSIRILVRQGIYTEDIYLPKTKPIINLIKQKNTVIKNNDLTDNI